MAWTARGDDDKKEYFDSPEELERKVQQLADWVRESKTFLRLHGEGRGSDMHRLLQWNL